MRLNGYDYTREGLYFITICVHNRECLFGFIKNGVMEINTLGAIANKFWMEIPNHYLQVKLHEHIIMPNHLHGIIEIPPKWHVPPKQHVNTTPRTPICQTHFWFCFNHHKPIQIIGKTMVQQKQLRIF
jgi:REP element-mobilizing transposase RayT